MENVSMFRDAFLKGDLMSKGQPLKSVIGRRWQSFARASKPVEGAQRGRQFIQLCKNYVIQHSLQIKQDTVLN